jgi:Bacterial Ig-like domain (group 3)
MSRMFHRVLATSVIGAAALAAPVTAMAADSGGGGGSGVEPAPTAIVLHLPKHVEAGQPVVVSARVSTPQAAADQGGKGADKPGQGTGKHKGAGHGKKGKKHHKGAAKRRHKVTGKVEFLLDGKPEPPVEVSHGRASEKIEIPVGRHTLVAQYSGDDEHLASKSAPVTFELTAAQDGPDGQGAQNAGNADDPKGSVGTNAQADTQDSDYPTLGQDTQDPTFDQGWDEDQDDQGPGWDTPNQSGDEDQI